MISYDKYSRVLISKICIWCHSKKHYPKRERRGIGDRGYGQYFFESPYIHRHLHNSTFKYILKYCIIAKILGVLSACHFIFLKPCPAHFKYLNIPWFKWNIFNWYFFYSILNFLKPVFFVKADFIEVINGNKFLLAILFH